MTRRDTGHPLYRAGFEHGWAAAMDQARRELSDRVQVAIEPVTVAPGSYVITIDPIRRPA